MVNVRLGPGFLGARELRQVVQVAGAVGSAKPQAAKERVRRMLAMEMRCFTLLGTARARVG